jgi:hypothetical protein
MFSALIVSRILETPRWITEQVIFKSDRHAQQFLDGTALEDLPDGNIVETIPIFPPDGQTLDPLSADSAVHFTSPSEAAAVILAKTVRDTPPDHLKRHLAGRSTPIYVVDPQTQNVRTVSGS